MRAAGVGVGVARGDIALLRRGLESCVLVAKPTLEQITDIAMKTSTSDNSILRFFKPPIPFSVIQQSVLSQLSSVHMLTDRMILTFARAARETAASIDVR